MTRTTAIKRLLATTLIIGLLSGATVLGVHAPTHGGALNPQPLPPRITGHL